jgi:hypothetical protein
LESITNVDKAKKRLEHNSYDILLLKDGFIKDGTIKAASMAYAMTRPTIIITSNVFRLIYYTAWHYCSEFSNLYKISKKLISFNNGTENLLEKIRSKTDYSTKYFNEVTLEIAKNTF